MMLSSSPRPPLGAGTERVPPSPASSSAPAGPSKELEEAAASLSRDDAYLADLLSFGAERLSKEPELLRDDQARVQRQLQDTAFKNYKAFVSTAECIEKVGQGLAGVEKHLESLQEKIPTLEEECLKYEDFMTENSREQAHNRQLLSNFGPLLEILEVTQLMETCIRNKSYDEALDLDAFVHKLTVLHPSVHVVQNLRREAKALSQTMLTQLCDRLSGSLQLPECLRIVGYLRRMGAFTESGLREKFLACRDVWFESLVAGLSDVESDHYTYIKRLTDYTRVHMFDIVMQYRAVFSDESHAAGAANGDTGTRARGVATAGPACTPPNFLHVWSSGRISRYVASLSKHLAHIHEGANLSSVIEHCMYCGMSLGRIGLDFRCLLVPIFEQAVVSLFKKHAESAVNVFGSMLDNHKWPRAVPGASAASRTATDQAAAEPLGTPPYALMQHPPLAVFANAILGSFNELRHCAPQTVAAEVTAAFDKAFEDVARALKWYAIAADLDEGERAAFEDLCKQHRDVLVPYLKASFERIYTKA